MLKKLDIGTSEIEQVEAFNALVDAVNNLDGLIGLTNNAVQALAKENNIHEKQIDELQMKLEPEKCEPSDPYAEQRKWIGKLCRFRDDDYKNDQWDYGLLQAVAPSETAQVWKAGCFKHNLGHWYEHCEPVKPDDDVIFKGEQDEFCRRYGL